MRSTSESSHHLSFWALLGWHNLGAKCSNTSALFLMNKYYRDYFSVRFIPFSMQHLKHWNEAWNTEFHNRSSKIGKKLSHPEHATAVFFYSNLLFFKLKKPLKKKKTQKLPLIQKWMKDESSWRTYYKLYTEIFSGLFYWQWSLLKEKTV